MNLKTGVELSGRFALLRRVGKNPSANVWLAVDGKRDAKVLVCVLHKHIAGDEGRREALYEAVSRMAEFDHPSILKIHESRLQDSGYDYYVKEFAEGESMHDAVLEGRLGRGKVIPVILAIGDALHYAHLRGMVHRDVNPGNILIDADMVPRLTSFSLGRADGSDSIATEIATDVYSLAMTAVFALHGDDLPMLEVVRDAASFIDSLDTTPAIRTVLKRATQLDKNRRFRDAKAFTQALDAAFSGRPLPGKAPPPPPRGRAAPPPLPPTRAPRVPAPVVAPTVGSAAAPPVVPPAVAPPDASTVDDDAPASHSAIHRPALFHPIPDDPSQATLPPDRPLADVTPLRPIPIVRPPAPVQPRPAATDEEPPSAASRTVMRRPAQLRPILADGEVAPATTQADAPEPEPLAAIPGVDAPIEPPADEPDELDAPPVADEPEDASLPEDDLALKTPPEVPPGEEPDAPEAHDTSDTSDTSDTPETSDKPDEPDKPDSEEPAAAPIAVAPEPPAKVTDEVEAPTVHEPAAQPDEGGRGSRVVIVLALFAIAAGILYMTVIRTPPPEPAPIAARTRPQPPERPPPVEAKVPETPVSGAISSDAALELGATTGAQETSPQETAAQETTGALETAGLETAADATTGEPLDASTSDGELATSESEPTTTTATSGPALTTEPAQTTGPATTDPEPAATTEAPAEATTGEPVVDKPPVDKPPKTKKPPTEPVEKRKRTLAATLTSLQRRAKNSCARLSSGPTTVTVELELDGDAGKITATATGSHSITGLGRCVTGAISKSNYGPFETPGPEPITLDITFE